MDQDEIRKNKHEGDTEQAVPATRARILVADDEESMRFFLDRSLRRLGFEVESAVDGLKAIERFEARRFDVAVVDLKMPGADGIEVLTRIRSIEPGAIVILMTAYGTIRSAVDAMKQGAFDYITKPFEIDELQLLIDRALEKQAMEKENRALRQIVDSRSSYAGLIGQSPAMHAVYETIDRVRASTATVLITGESGTGKELVARAVHVHSQHFNGEFVPLNCSALPENLIESELFGYEPGAFTGAVQQKRGLVERADRGTLFLDEISEIGLNAQAKLVRFLQEREFTRLGASEVHRVFLRIIAASNQDLQSAVREGRFRQDLYWRLNVVPLHLPALRERREDIPVLVSHFMELYCKPLGRPPDAITVDAMIVLSNYSWPGNVRELQNTIERLVVFHEDKASIDVDDLPEEIRSNTRASVRRAVLDRMTSFQDAQRAFEIDYLSALFERTEGNVSKAAQLAGISRQNLHRRIKQLGLDPDLYRGDKGCRS
ncbi:MAG: sigma-54 dependent transcriptional regulator [Planctomycetota bacterium]